MMDEAELDSRKVFIANRFIIGASAKASRNAEVIKNDAYSDLLHADEILV